MRTTLAIDEHDAAREWFDKSGKKAWATGPCLFHDVRS